MLSAQEIETKIKASLPSAQVVARDLTGGGDHWQVEVVAKEFIGLNMVQQHQLIYKALGDWMREKIHALAINARVPT